MSKKKKNAFSLFMDDVREAEEEKGNNLPENYQDLIDFVSVKWKALSNDEKQRYKDLAKANKGQNGNRLDCTGRSITEVEQEEKEREQREPRMLSYIENLLKELGNVEKIKDERFFVISFNVFCVTTKKQFLAAEVGLIEYSIRNGITREFQCFIDPGPIPVGYSSACRQRSENTHQIPLSGYNDEDDEEVVLVKRTDVMAKILEFIDPDPDVIQPIYCVTEELYQTKFVLEHLQVGSEKIVDFYVVDFACLFLKLFQNVSDVLMSVGIVREYLHQCAVFTYNINSCCDYHWEKDNPHHCALCVVKRSCFILSDYICDGYNIVPILNKHLPEISCGVIYSLIGSSSSSVASWQRSRCSSQASISGTTTPKLQYPRNFQSHNFRPISTEAEINKNEPISLEPLRLPSVLSITSGVSKRVQEYVYDDSDSEDAWAKPPTSTSLFANVVGLSIPREILSDAVYEDYDDGVFSEMCDEIVTYRSCYRAEN